MAVTTRKNRQTGTKVTVGKASEMELDGDWLTICEDHGFILNHRTRKLAEHHAPTPRDWCTGCKALAVGHKTRLAKLEQMLGDVFYG